MDQQEAQIARPRERKSSDLSYKFQRLRERIRLAVTSGELIGKLPGERQLAKRFHCNAKTLSKALTDLAAEGLLDRSIGRGTFVRGTETAKPKQGPWLLVVPAGEIDSPLIDLLRQANPDIKVEQNDFSTRPSFINQFAGVIDFTGTLPEAVMRDLVVRNIPTVVVGHEPRTYAMHSVLIDRTIGAANLTRDLLMAGHRRLCAVEARGRHVIVDAMRSVARRYAPDASIDSCLPEEVSAAIEQQFTALVCDSEQSARTALALAERLGVSVPAQLAVVAVGYVVNEPLCSGYFVTAAEKAKAIIKLLSDAAPRPATLWLAPEFVQKDTLTNYATLDSGTLANAMALPSIGA